jgi:hypothetical protein
MMLPTHVLAGMLLAAPLAFVAPELAPAGFAAGFAGGLFPDLDMYVGHRKTLHFPVYYSGLALAASVAALAAPSVATTVVAFFLLGAALHSVADVFGGGLELRPWEGTSDRAVYSHHHDRWLAPRRVVGYDGSLGDLALSIGLAVPLVILVDGTLQALVLAAVAVAVAYALLRRRLADLAAVVFPRLPDVFGPYLPDRYDDEDEGASPDR